MHSVSKPAMLVLSLVALGFGFLGVPRPAEASDTTVSYEKDLTPPLKKYCGACHSTPEPPAGVNPLKFKSGAEAAKDAALWDRVLRAVRSGHMPPKGTPQPTKAERDLLISKLEGFLKTECGMKTPGRVTVRRLNRAEYAYSVKDLLGVDFDPSDVFPNDDVGYGFDNIGDVLSMSPMLMEKYLDAAETIAARALVTAGSQKIGITGGEFKTDKGGAVRDDLLVLATTSEASVDVEIPFEGDYRVTLTASGTQAGPEPCKMRLLKGQEVLQQFDVPNLPTQPATYSGPTVRLRAGSNRLRVAFINDFYQPENPDPNRRDRNLIVHRIDIEGPIGGSVELPESHRRLVPEPPAKGRELVAAKKALTTLASRAFRRPATPTETERLVALVQLGLKDGETYESALRIGVAGVLISPQFLFRLEEGGDKARDLNDYEIGARLASFLWSSVPDASLTNLAAAGKLKDPAVLESEALRMLADPKGRRLGETFASQWLQLGKLESLKLTRNYFPMFTEKLKEDMRVEALTFFDDIATHDRSILDFIDSERMFVNGRLATHYEMTGITGDEIREVKRQSNRRGGLLGMGAVLLLNSNPTRTSPTKRGKWILEQILGEPPPPPPPGVEVLKPEANENRMKTLRAQLEAHRSDPGCANCHSRMDPLGFGLENFDASGAWRNKDNFIAVDASGELPDGSKFAGPKELREILLQRKDRFAAHFAETMLTFALGRGITPDDTCFVDEIAKKATENDYRFTEFVKGVVRSDAFRKRAAKP